MISKDVISFSVTEEVGKLPSGTLTLRDESGVYSKVFRNGLKFNLSWGYKVWNYGITPSTPEDLLRTGIRNGLQCMIQTPSGAGSEQGETNYSVTFYGLEFFKKKENRVFESGTVGSVVAQLFQELGCSSSIIDFPEMSKLLRKSAPVRQRDTNFELLSKLAREYNTHFQIGYTPVGIKIAVFVDTRKIDSNAVKGFLKSVTGGGSEKALYYNSGSLSNVKSYSWQQHVGENGTGDGVTITYVQGRPVVSRFVTSGGSVTLWKLDQEKVRQYIHSKNNISDELQIGLQIANTKDFDSEIERGVKVRDFFYKDDVPFAPQGQGYTVNCAMHGDPVLTGLTEIKFKNGFPAPLQRPVELGAFIKFYTRRVTHNFNKQEYTSDVEICDTFTLTGSNIAPENMVEGLSV